MGARSCPARGRPSGSGPAALGLGSLNLPIYSQWGPEPPSHRGPGSPKPWIRTPLTTERWIPRAVDLNPPHTGCRSPLPWPAALGDRHYTGVPLAPRSPGLALSPWPCELAKAVPVLFVFVSNLINIRLELQNETGAAAP